MIIPSSDSASLAALAKFLIARRETAAWQYRDKHYPIGPDGRPTTPEQEFREAFLEGFNKRY